MKNNIDIVFNNISKVKIEWILIFIIFLIICFMLYKSHLKQKEQFMGKVNRAVREVGNVGRKMDRIPRQINSVGNKINNVGNQIGREVDSKFRKFFRQVENLVTKKIGAFFNSFIKSLKGAIVDPLLALFVAIGNVFVQIFKILRKLGEKIGSLPNCMPFYIISGTYNVTRNFFKSLIPAIIWNFFGNIFRFIGKYTRPTVNWIIGYDKIKKRCYNFNVNKEVRSMGRGFKVAGNKFKNDFGRFRGIKI